MSDKNTEMTNDREAFEKENRALDVGSHADYSIDDCGAYIDENLYTAYYWWRASRQATIDDCANKARRYKSPYVAGLLSEQAQQVFDMTCSEIGNEIMQLSNKG